MVVTTAEMYADRYKLRKLEQRMNLLGDKIIRLEKMRDNEFNTHFGIALCNKRIREAADEQDLLNDQLHELLSKYTVTYGKGFFTVRSGNKHFTVYCKLDEPLTMTKIIINR